MHLRRALTGALLLLVPATAWIAAGLPSGRGSARAAERPEAGPATWAGSEACRECHAELFARWSATGHALTLRDFAPDVVARPFDGEFFEARGVEQRIGPGPTMRVEGPGGTEREFPVEMVIGARRIQMFTTTLEDGRIQVLPVFLEVPTGEWFDYADFIFGGPNDFDIPPDSPNSWYGPARNFNSRCGGCHTTDYDIGYDPDTGRYDTTWKERRVSCENCHGPGAAHVVFHRTRAEGDDPIVNPAKLTIQRANQVCGRCHAEGTLVDPDFRPGEDLFAHVDVAGLEDEKHLAPDGRARELIHELVPNMENRCGPVSCTQCHDPHGRGIPGDLIRPLDDPWTCTQCHDEFTDPARVEAHTHHPADSEGSSCFGCHMPRLTIEGGHGRIYDHTISIPSPRNSDRFGLPNACRDCHLTEFPGWEEEHVDRWWPDAEEDNHRVALAEAVAAGRAGRAGAEELLRPWLEHSEPVYRAGAARLLADSGIDLRPLLADDHPMVVRAAVEGVARTHPDALLPLLGSDSAVLRDASARALLTRAPGGAYAWVRERPGVRADLRAVLEGLVDLRDDRAELHYYLGILLEQDGEPVRAARAFRRYLRFYPWNRELAARVEELERAPEGE